jgi:hypothetical protein
MAKKLLRLFKVRGKLIFEMPSSIVVRLKQILEKCVYQESRPIRT